MQITEKTTISISLAVMAVCVAASFFTLKERTESYHREDAAAIKGVSDHVISIERKVDRLIEMKTAKK